MSREFSHRASIVLNIVLIVMIAVGLYLRPASAARLSPAIEARATQSQKTSTDDRAEPSRYSDIAPAAEQRRWVVDQLRAMGFSNDVRARMVMLNLDEYSEERGKEVSEKCKNDRATMAEFQLAFEMGRDAEMRAALGDEGFNQWDHANMMREANGGKAPMSASEAEAVYGFWKKLQRCGLEMKEAKLKGTMDDALTANVWEKSVAEYNRQMKDLLGDARYAKAQQTDDGAAVESLRRDFAKANPSDAQFNKLLKVQQQWGERRAEIEKQFQSDQSSAAYEDQLRALDEARDQEFQRVLGAEAYDTFQKQQDPNYNRMKKYAGIWGLDNGKIDYVYGALKSYEKTMSDYQTAARALEAKGQTVDWAAVDKNLLQLAEQTQRALQSSLGQDSFSKLQRNGVIQLQQVQLPGDRPF